MTERLGSVEKPHGDNPFQRNPGKSLVSAPFFPPLGALMCRALVFLSIGTFVHADPGGAIGRADEFDAVVFKDSLHGGEDGFIQRMDTPLAIMLLSVASCGEQFLHVRIVFPFCDLGG